MARREELGVSSWESRALKSASSRPVPSKRLSLVDFSFQVESDYCLLLALPCGRDQEDVVNQTESLKAAFISYLQAKQAAGIINVPNPGSNQVQARRVGCRRKLCVDNGPASLGVVVEALH